MIVVSEHRKASVESKDHADRSLSTSLCGVIRVTSWLTLLVIMGRLLGFLREVVTARQFGTSAELDAYLLANTLPGLVVTALPEALVVAFVPFLTGLSATGASIRKGVLRLGGPLVVASLLLGGTLFVFAGTIMAALLQADGRPALLGSVGLLRVLSLSVPLAALVGLGASACNASARFHVPALHAVVFNVVILACLVLRPYEVSSLAYGVIAGLTLQAALVWCTAWFSKPGRDPKDLSVGAAYRALAPMLFYTVLIQANTAINRVLASGLGEGAISTLNYATVLVNLPASLFAATLATVVLQRFSLLKATAREDEAALGLGRTVVGSILLTMPIAVGTAVLAKPLVHGFFARGRFTAEAATQCADLLLWLSPTIVAVSLIHLAVRYLNSQGRANELWMLALISTSFSIGIKILLVEIWGLKGIAIGTTVATILTASWMLWAAESRRIARGLKRLLCAFSSEISRGRGGRP